jgi:hypothetical protein
MVLIDSRESLTPASAAPQARTVARAKPRKGKKATSSTKPATAREGSKKELARLSQLEGMEAGKCF